MSDWNITGESRMTDAQRRLLNAACGDLSRGLKWHGWRLSKDDYRHMLAGIQIGWRQVPGVDLGEGPRGFILLTGSSLDMTRSQATEAITMAFWLGDDPAAQGLDCSPVRWCDAVCIARGIIDSEVAA